MAMLICKALGDDDGVDLLIFFPPDMLNIISDKLSMEAVKSTTMDTTRTTTMWTSPTRLPTAMMSWTV